MSSSIYFCILDFEATCWEGQRRHDHEIIEFPSILYKFDRNAHMLEKLSEFSRYVRPTIHPALSKFCTELTGITQETVDASQTIDIVYNEHYQWLKSIIGEGDGVECYFVTCGDCDLQTMLPMEISNKHLPAYPQYECFINIKKAFGKFYKMKNVHGMTDMLAKCNLELQGRHHSGIDDTRNIARVWETMIRDGFWDK